MKKILILTTLLLLTACTTTPYRPYESLWQMGYSDVQMDENIYSVEYKGNQNFATSITRDYTLLRSAEIAKEKGYNFFVVTESYDDVRRGSTTSKLTARSTKTGDTINTDFSGGETTILEAPTTTMIIAFFKEKPASGISYNADIIIESIRGKYKIKPEEA